MICHRAKHSRSLSPDMKWKMMLRGCSWIGAKEVVKSCKPVHISDIVSKLLTGQGLINSREELFLLHLPYSLQKWWTAHAESDIVGKNFFFYKCANSLLEVRKRRVCQSECGAYFALNLIYILRSEGWVLGSYTDSSESQSGLCILLPLGQRRMRRRRKGGGSVLMRSLYSRQDLQLGSHPSPNDQWAD